MKRFTMNALVALSFAALVSACTKKENNDVALLAPAAPATEAFSTTPLLGAPEQTKIENALPQAPIVEKRALVQSHRARKHGKRHKHSFAKRKKGKHARHHRRAHKRRH